MTTTYRDCPRLSPTRFAAVPRWAAAVAILGVLMVSLGADQPAAKPKKLVLFDGKTLDGWKKTDFTAGGDVKVEDGTIVLSIGSSMSGITSSRKDLPVTNYELTYEAMRLSGYDFFAAATSVSDRYLQYT